MKLRVSSGLLMGSAMIGITAVSTGQPRLVQQSRPPISLQELAERRIEGELGHPLGTIAELKGTLVPNPQGKGDSIAPDARVDEINGRPLDRPIVMSRIRFPVQRGPEPKAGDAFHCFGYETGSFSGVVRGSEKFEPTPQDVGFGFTTRFHVMKVDWVRQP